jgi:integrase
MPLTLIRRANGYWYVTGTVTIWRNGQPDTVDVRKSTKTRDEKIADGIRRQIENAAAEQSVTGKKPSRTVREAAQRYLKHGGEARFVDLVVEHLGSIPVDRVTQQDMDDGAHAAYPTQTDATRRRQFYAPAIAILRSEGVATVFKRSPDSQKRTVFFLPDKADAAIRRLSGGRWPNPWTPALATFLFCQGSRVSETINLDGKEDVSLRDRFAIFRDPKNGLERMIPLTSRTVAALSQLPNIGKRGPLFLRYDGRPYSDREGRGYRLMAWYTAIADIGLNPNTHTLHTARHSWATWFYAVTKDVVRMTSEGGWESDEWKRYVKLANPQIADAAVRYGFIEEQNPQNGSRKPIWKVV